nr:transglutaminase domain-containing protein [Leucobacter luti]
MLVLAIALLAGIAAWPVYRGPEAWLAVGAAAAAAFAITWAGRRWRWGALTAVALLLGFVALLVPAAVPSALDGAPAGLLRGLGDGLAAVALGWKQILTLTLPLGSYQAVLVPLFTTVYAAAAAATWLAVRGDAASPWAALPAAAVVAFGTVFGPVELSDPLALGPLTVAAPRELAIWAAAAILITGWIAWTSGAARRAALRLGRGPGARLRGITRGATGAAIVVAALAAGAILAPAATSTPRTVPRDRIDPVVVVREQTSPLAGYRVLKRDAAYDAPLFTVTGDGPLPGRMRLAVMDQTSGVDFTVAAGNGTFTRFPSGDPVTDPALVRVAIESGYSGIWVPLTAELGAPPEFAGPRAADLADGFYVDRDTGAGIAVPTAAGLRAGDAYRAELSAAPDARLDAAPAHAHPDLDLAELPQLERWLAAQRLPATGEGLAEAIDRLRARGYLSHALSDQGDRAWLDALAAAYGTRFVASPGGHSLARIEELFEQLNDQAEAAGTAGDDAALVAGIGDDEQFAAAAVLLARALGFDARIVLGVRLGGDGVPGVPACESSCTGANVAAWIEARGADGVWAPLDVTPQVAVPPTALESGERLPEHATVPEERDAPENDPEFGSGSGNTAPAQATPADTAAGLLPALRWIGLAAAALLLLAALALFIPAVKALRTRRRRRADSAEVRALGAWEELLDAHADAGTPAVRAARVSGGRTQLSRRDLGAAIPGGSAIAAAVDRAVFAGESVDAAEADRLWSAVTDELSGLRAGRSLLARLRARFSLASFGVRGFGRERSDHGE